MAALLATGNELAIDLHEVAKTYRGRFARGQVQALRGITMQVRRGEIFGLLGPNGAGKSTLVKILMTVIRPTRCKGSMLGHAVGHKPTLGRVGYLPEHHRFADYLTGAQVIDFYGAMANTPRRERIRRRGELLDMVGMSDWAGKRVRSYSKGMRQRIGIAQSLINNPEMVLLDEPTDGVDPVGRRDIRAICARLRDEGRTVFINSHLLSELEMVCDRVAILVKGVVWKQGTLNELTLGQQHFVIELSLPDREASPQTIRRLLPESLVQDAEITGPTGAPLAETRRVGVRGTLAGGLSVEIDHQAIRVGTTEAADIQPLIDALRARDATIRGVRLYRPSLEDLFMQAVTDPATGEAMTPGADQRKGRGGRARA